MEERREEYTLMCFEAERHRESRGDQKHPLDLAHPRRKLHWDGRGARFL